MGSMVITHGSNLLGKGGGGYNPFQDVKGLLIAPLLIRGDA